MALKTTTALVADVRRQLMLPDTATLGTQAADILAAADLEMTSRILPLMQSVNEEYGVLAIDIALEPGKSQYRMPNQAAGAKLRDVRLLVGAQQRILPKIEIEQLGAWNTVSRGSPVGFYLQAGSINLVPAPSSGALRVRYYQPHGTFISWAGASQAAVAGRIITAVSYSTDLAPNDTVTFGMATFVPVAASLYDVIAATTPYETLAQNAVCTDGSPSPFSIRVTTGQAVSAAINMSPNIQIQDIVCPSGSVPVVQLPDEAYRLLLYRTCIAVLVQIGDLERAQVFEGMYQQHEAAWVGMSSSRVDGSPPKLMGFEQDSWFNNSPRRW